MVNLNRRDFIRKSSLLAASPFLVQHIFSQSGNNKQVLSFARENGNEMLIQFPNYNLSEVPFSRAGSYLKITALNGSGSNRLQLCTVRNTAVTYKDDKHWAHDFYEIALYKDSKEVEYSYQAYPWCLKLLCKEGSLTIAFSNNETLVFSAIGVHIVLRSCKTYAWRYVDTVTGALKLYDSQAGCTHQIIPYNGTTVRLSDAAFIEQNGGKSTEFPYAVFINGDNGAKAYVGFSDVESNWKDKLPDVTALIDARKAEYGTWQKKIPVVSEQYQATAEAAWFLLWNNIVEAKGYYTKSAILMSKNWMNKVWAWDNCFNALSVVNADEDLAWNQLALFFDQQAPTGMLPDSVSDEKVSYGFLKPPIYGWTILKLLEIDGKAHCLPHIEKIYDQVALLTEWWYKFRDTDGNGICHYMNGNDSGWDNSTVFDQGVPVEAADLSAHLILQTEALATMANMLGKSDDEVKWQMVSQDQLSELLSHNVKNDRFFSPVTGKTSARECYSLLNYIPMVLGNRLPEKIKHAMVKDLSDGGSFLTGFGLATEQTSSPQYKADGYWRGPIWAPSTYLIFDGLVDAGEVELATLIAQRYCDMCVQHPGMYENYDAITGKGNNCPGYSWTANVFLLLAQWLYKNTLEK
jgi:putative isomerase